MYFINNKESKTIYKGCLIQNTIFKPFRKSYLMARKYVSVSFLYYIFKHIFIIILSIENNALSL